MIQWPRLPYISQTSQKQWKSSKNAPPRNGWPHPSSCQPKEEYYKVPFSTESVGALTIRKLKAAMTQRRKGGHQTHSKKGNGEVRAKRDRPLVVASGPPRRTADKRQLSSAPFGRKLRPRVAKPMRHPRVRPNCLHWQFCWHYVFKSKSIRYFCLKKSSTSNNQEVVTNVTSAPDL